MTDHQKHTSVFHIRPGDVLLIGNIGSDINHATAHAAAVLLERIGINALIFENDITVTTGAQHE